MPEFEKEFKEEVEMKISTNVDRIASIKELLRRRNFKELEVCFGSIGEALRLYNLWRAERDFYKQVYITLWKEEYNPPVGWME